MVNDQTITGVVLTLNEERDLPRALKSLAWCDDILVVDSGSSDATLQVANDCGARCLQHIQHPPFLITEQRNWALEHGNISSDWVLFLDADEEVGIALARTIRRCINITHPYSAYELTPRYWFLGKWLKRTQGFPNWHPRLVKLGEATFEGGVWESFKTRTSSSIGRVYEPYEHYAFSKGIDDWLERHMRYAECEASSAYEFLRTGDSNSITTLRAHKLRIIASYLWPMRPLARFLQKYLFQLGFLEGWQGLTFSSLMAFYELIVVLKIIQKTRREKGIQL